MTTRRQFIRGAVAAAVAASLPGGDGVALYSAKHPQYTYQTYGFASEHMDGARMAAALARSMMQTKEIVAKNVLEKMFPEYELRASLLHAIDVTLPDPPT